MVDKFSTHRTDGYRIDWTFAGKDFVDFVRKDDLPTFFFDVVANNSNKVTILAMCPANNEPLCSFTNYHESDRVIRRNAQLERDTQTAIERGFQG